LRRRTSLLCGRIAAHHRPMGFESSVKREQLLSLFAKQATAPTGGEPRKINVAKRRAHFNATPKWHGGDDASKVNEST